MKPTAAQRYHEGIQIRGWWNDLTEQARADLLRPFFPTSGRVSDPWPSLPRDLKSQVRSLYLARRI